MFGVLHGVSLSAQFACFGWGAACTTICSNSSTLGGLASDQRMAEHVT